MALAFTPDTKILIDCGVSYCAVCDGPFYKGREVIKMDPEVNA